MAAILIEGFNSQLIFSHYSRGDDYFECQQAYLYCLEETLCTLAMKSSTMTGCNNLYRPIQLIIAQFVTKVLCTVTHFLFDLTHYIYTPITVNLHIWINSVNVLQYFLFYKLLVKMSATTPVLILTP